MKINRSTKCYFNDANRGKLRQLNVVLAEYGRVVNCFIDNFWEKCPSKAELLKPVVDSVDTWFSARLRKVAAREAVDLIRAAKTQKKPVTPVHRGNRMCVSSTIASLRDGTGTTFDRWLHLHSIGNKIILDLPIKLHKHINKLLAWGKRLESYVITRDYVQFCFKIETGPKKVPDACIGVDTGIKALASTSNGAQFGTDIEVGIERIKRCKHGSKGQKKARNALKQRMNEVAKEVVSTASLVVVEKLKGITKNTRRRLGKNMRRSIGNWNVRYWLSRLQMACEKMNVSFRTVSPWKTSQTCSVCGHIDRKNRSGQVFLCRSCGYSGNADINAAKNILERFLSGPYGAGCKPCLG